MDSQRRRLYAARESKVSRATRVMKTTLAVLTLITLAACSGLTVKTEHDQRADFSQFRTYAWIEGVPARDAAIESQIHAAIDRELPFKGLAKAAEPAAPDLLVAT